jgi:hypothetical protein
MEQANAELHGRAANVHLLLDPTSVLANAGLKLSGCESRVLKPSTKADDLVASRLNETRHQLVTKIRQI